MEKNENHPALVAALERGSRAAGIAVAILGLAVLLGWGFDLEFLKNPAHVMAMKPNAAAAFLLLGLALALSGRDALRWQRALKHVLAGTAVAIASLSVAEYVFGVNLGIDQLLFQDPHSGAIAPGRMAFITALSFLLLGLALDILEVRTPSGQRPSEWLATAALLFPMVGAADYAFDWRPELTGIAIHTVVGLLILGAGVLAARADEGWMRPLTSLRGGGAAARRLLPFAFCVPLVVGGLRWAGHRAGVYGVEFGVALMTTATIVLLVAAVWWSARQLNRVEERQLAERERGEEELRRINRALRAIHHCGHALVHAETEAELLRDVCRVAVDDGGYRMAWVGYAEQDGGKRVRLVAHGGVAEQYAQGANITWDETERGRGPTGTAIRTGEIQLCHDVLAEQGMLPWREAAIAQGLRSTAVFPLKEGGRPFGALSIYSAEAHAFQPEEVELLGKLAEDLAYGIVSLRARGERQRAEEAMQQASRYARSLLEASLDPLVTISKQGRILDVNRAAELVTGVRRDELIGSDFCDYFTEPEKAREGYERVFAEGAVHDYPLSIRHRSGAVTEVLYNATVYRNASGEVEGVFAAARDITERRRMEQELEAERQRFSDVLDRLPAYVVLLAPDYTVPFANKYFRERFGESEGRRCYERLFQRDSPCEVCESFEVLRDGQPRQWNWQGPDGRDYEIHDFPFHDKGTELILEMGIDVTERKRAEDKVQQASRYARSLLEASLDPLVTISTQGQIMDVNRATELVTGYDRNHLIGSDFSDYFTQPAKAREGYKQVFAEGSVHDYPLSIRHLSGPVTDVLYNATVYKNATGEIEGVFAAARDITERKRAEQALAERTAELERSNKELQDFASIASHDLQEPLRKVTAFGDRLRTHAGAALDETGSDYLKRMQNAASRMSGLVEALLEYSQVTTKARPFERVDMNAVVADVLSDLEARTQESAARVEVGSLPTLMADKLQMRQLLQNLLANALKFHQPGKAPRVHVSAMRAPDRSWSIAVEDHGVGFDETYTDRIFRPFQRLHGRAEFEGSGMGLAICRKIVDRHGGTINAHSRPGEGAVFTVTLPASQKEGAHDADVEAEYDFDRRGR